MDFVLVKTRGFWYKVTVGARSHFSTASISKRGLAVLAQVSTRMKRGGEKATHFADRLPQNGVEDGTQLVGVSPSFREILTLTDFVATNDCTVLLEGESGTGKELLARRIHFRSPRRDGPFIPVNCPGISESLFESQFYGHVQGAFTGATTDTLGIVRAAEGGTLLLDEVGELQFSLQAKLLRLLQEREVTPVGAATPISVDVRFIAATNCSLVSRIADGTFRTDLYHRLNVVRIEIPPLRVRPEDIEPLLDYYLEYYSQQYRAPVRRLSEHLRRILREYPWYGNVRELCCYVERLYAANLPPAPPTFDIWDDAYRHPKPIEPAPGRMSPIDHSPVYCSLAEIEAHAIRTALESTGYNRSAAARLLNIHRSTLLRKIRLLGFDKKD